MTISFGVPLHTEPERVSVEFDRFDYAIGSSGRDRTFWRDAVDRLMMIGSNFELIEPDNFLKKRSGLQPDCMARIAVLERIRFLQGDILNQSSAAHDIEKLAAVADAEERFFLPVHGVDEKSFQTRSERVDEPNIGIRKSSGAITLWIEVFPAADNQAIELRGELCRARCNFGFVIDPWPPEGDAFGACIGQSIDIMLKISLVFGGSRAGRVGAGDTDFHLAGFCNPPILRRQKYFERLEEGSLRIPMLCEAPQRTFG